VSARRLATVALLTVVSAVLAADAARELDVQGHRGCRGLLPENSIPAFERALELGVTTLELDLQVTRDRVVIVTHDQQLDPAHCAYDDGRRVPKTPFKDLDHADLAEVECGSRQAKGFREQRPLPGVRIPTFADVLALARNASYPVRVNVEVKLQDTRAGIPVDEFARLMLDGLRAAGMESRATIQSFDPAALRAVAAIAPDIPRSILVRKRARYDAVVEESGATILSPKHPALRREDVTRMQARGIAVIPWTVNEPADIRRMLSLGVDGIISDYPDRVLSVMAEVEVHPAD